MLESQDQVRFEMLVMPHLDAVFNLARWLLGSSTDAEDVAREAMLRSYRFFPGFHGGYVRGLAAADRTRYLLHLAGEE